MGVMCRVFFYFYSIGLSQLPHGPRLGSESWVTIIHLHGADEEGVRYLSKIDRGNNSKLNMGLIIC